MGSEYVLAFKENRIIVGRLQVLLEEKEVRVIVRSDTLPGYELTYHLDELFVLKADLKKAAPIIDKYKTFINQ